MKSLFDGFVDVTDESYALTISMNSSGSTTVLILEHADQSGNRILQLFEFSPSMASNITWHSALTHYQLTIESSKSRQVIHDEIEALNAHESHVSGRVVCPQVQLPGFHSTSTYIISKERAQALLTNCMSKKKPPSSCTKPYICAAHQLQAIGIDAPRLDDNDPTSWPNIFPSNLLSVSSQLKTEKTSKSKEPVTQAEQDYLTHLRVLEREIEIASKDQYFSSIGVKGSNPDLSPGAQNMTPKQHQARNKALYEANRVLSELKKQLPLTKDGQRLEVIPQRQKWEDGAPLINDAGLPEVADDDALLIRLTDICSHTAQGLHFIATGGQPFECNLFFDVLSKGETKRMIYDTNAHKESMVRLEGMAHSLKGAGWKDCRKALLIIAGVMLVAAGILAAVPTAGVSLAVALGGAAILTAGVGFFAGRDTGLVGAVKGVKMKDTEPSSWKPK